MNRSESKPKAFSLIEVTLALGVAGFALIAIFALLPVGITSNRTSIQQTVAASVARGVVADLRATQTSIPPANKSVLFQIPIPAVAAATSTVTIFFREDGSVAQSNSPTVVNVDADPAQNPLYRATLTFYPPASGRGATALRVLVTWPALADSKASITPVNFSGSFESVTALDRN